MISKGEILFIEPKMFKYLPPYVMKNLSGFIREGDTYKFINPLLYYKGSLISDIETGKLLLCYVVRDEDKEVRNRFRDKIRLCEINQDNELIDMVKLYLINLATLPNKERYIPETFDNDLSDENIKIYNRKGRRAG